MKITKRQIRRIIKEELLNEVTPGEREEAIRLSHVDTKQPGGGGQIDTRKLTAELLRDMNRGTVTAEQGDAPDELYIMTGAAEGITIKVLRQGH